MRVHIIMKRTYLSWMTTVLMAFACVAFISCDKDDDKDGGGGIGSGNLNAGEASFSVNYGYYDLYDEDEGEKSWEFSFFNFDPSSSSLPQSVNELFIYFAVPETVEGIPVGTFNDFGVTVCKGVKPTREDDSGEYYSGIANGKRADVKLTVSKSGDKYTISFENLSLSQDGSDRATSASFSYTGKLEEFKYYDLE